MSYANGTPFLNLAQTVGTDHRDWFDENEAKLDLDTKMKTLWDGAASTSDILATLQEKVASLETDTVTLETVVDGHGSSITTINESLILINTALSALNSQVTNKFDSAGVADPYDATHGIYAIGDVVTYNGQRYKCVTAVTSAEPFDVSKWNAEDVQTVINAINSDLGDISDASNVSGDNTFEKISNLGIISSGITGHVFNVQNANIGTDNAIILHFSLDSSDADAVEIGMKIYDSTKLFYRTKVNNGWNNWVYSQGLV